jgi:hypothetical protein
VIGREVAEVSFFVWGSKRRKARLAISDVAALATIKAWLNQSGSIQTASQN